MTAKKDRIDKLLSLAALVTSGIALVLRVREDRRRRA